MQRKATYFFLGSFLRMYILSNFGYIHRYILIIFINSFSSFFAGLVLGLEPKIALAFSQLLIFFSIGFLSSFSTFSSFIWEVFDKLRNKEWLLSLYTAFLSLFFGLSLAFIGYRIVHD